MNDTEHMSAIAIIDGDIYTQSKSTTPCTSNLWDIIYSETYAQVAASQFILWQQIG